MKFLIRLLVTAAALGAASFVLPGIRSGGPLSLVLIALVFGLVNALIRPFLVLATCPMYVVTFGLFAFVVNALMLMLTAWLGRRLGIDFQVSGFWTALLGSLIVSVVSTILDALLADARKKD
jgi:putative membrane protein